MKKSSSKSSTSKKSKFSNGDDASLEKTTKKTKAKKSKKSGKSKKSKKAKSAEPPATLSDSASSTQSSSSESGELSDGSVDVDEELSLAMSAQKRDEGCWGKIYSSLSSHDLEILACTAEAFGNIDKPLYDIPVFGSASLITFNKTVNGLKRKWSILKGSFEKKKKSVSGAEKKKIENMIEASVGFIDEWLRFGGQKIFV